MTVTFTRGVTTDRNRRLDVLFNFPDYEDVLAGVRLASGYGLVSLGEMCSRRADKFDPTSATDEDFYYIDIGSIDTASKTINPDFMRGTEMTSSRMRQVTEAGDILVSSTRPTRGAIGLVPHFSENRIICSTAFLVLRCNPGFDPTIVLRGLDSDYVRLQFLRLSSGSGFPAFNISSSDLMEVLVPYPILKDAARKLTSELEELERGIIDCGKESTSIAVSVADHFNALMRVPPLRRAGAHRSGIIGKTRSFVAEASGGRLDFLSSQPNNAVLQAFEANWGFVPLGECLDEAIFRGKQPTYAPEGSAVVLKTRNVLDGVIDLLNAERVDFDVELATTSALRTNDLLVTSTGYGSLGRASIVISLDEPTFVDSHVSVLRMQPHYDPKFIELLIRSAIGQAQIERLFTGSSGQIELVPGALERLWVPRCDTTRGIERSAQSEIARECTAIEGRLHGVGVRSRTLHARIRRILDNSAFVLPFAPDFALSME